MLKPRVIPTLLLKDRGLYKGEKFKKHSYIGDPINTIKIFNDKEVDEIIILDIGSKNRPDFEYLKKVTREAFVPMCYGGGIKTFEDARKLFQIGFEKICLNSLYFENPSEIIKIIKVYGSQSVVLSIDVKKNFFGKYKIFTQNGKVKQQKSFMDVISDIKNISFGEVLLTNIDFEGKMSGYDFELLELVKNRLTMPLIIHGGANSKIDLEMAIQKGADACACGSMFVFHGINKAVLITYDSFYEKSSFEL